MPTEADWAFFHRYEEALYALYTGTYILIVGGTLHGVYDRQDDVFKEASYHGSCLVRFLGTTTPQTGI